jgi:hypothetical protein
MTPNLEHSSEPSSPASTSLVTPADLNEIQEIETLIIGAGPVGF